MKQPNLGPVTLCMAKAMGELSVAWYCKEKTQEDTSINRSYMAYFHALQAMIVEEHPDCHTFEEIASAFEEQYVKTFILGEDLYTSAVKVYNIRHDADYDVTYFPDVKEMNECFELAKEMVMSAIDVLGDRVDLSKTSYEYAPWNTNSPKAATLNDLDLDL